jgi:hypothetical protein
MRTFKYMVSYTIKREAERMIAFNATAFIDINAQPTTTARGIAEAIRQECADDYVRHYSDAKARRDKLNEDPRFDKFPEIKVPDEIDPERVTINNTVLLASFDEDNDKLYPPRFAPPVRESDKGPGGTKDAEDLERLSIVREMTEVVRQKKMSLVIGQDYEGASLLRWVERVLTFDGDKLDTLSLEGLLNIANAIGSRPTRQFDRMKAALERIAAWEMPETGLYFDEARTRPQSWESAYGSNGCRDVIKDIATLALADERMMRPARNQEPDLTPVPKEVGGTYFWNRHPRSGKTGNVVVVGGGRPSKGWQVRYLDEALNLLEALKDKSEDNDGTIFANDDELFKPIYTLKDK